ncbi:SET domain-containing protein isoform X2 [Tasmannia lanceolata]|uniref:SET domain-containing protein isoform X2 n=1 Tax=Tasmannia lanceolata TaxID=3420 RepID=UPI004063D67D
MDSRRQQTQLPSPVRNTKRTGTISLLLPPLSEKDPLFEKKKLLSARNVDLEFQIPFPRSSSPEEALQVLDEMVRAARILHLDETELYFVGDDEFGPFSPKNELESLNSVLSVINLLLPSITDDRVQVLQELHDATVDMIKSLGGKNIANKIIEKCTSDAEELLLQWGKDHGVRSKLQITYFEGAGRGAVAVADINIGDTALEIPESIIICEELVYESDMFHVLKDMDGITAETMLLLWSMKERYNANSKFKFYFEALPTKFNTGLSFGIDALAALEGTLLVEEIVQAREHLREQYDALCPPLCTNYPNIFRPELYTWDQFLWACELWYSNSMKVIFTDGKLRTCLVPIAGFLNHSLCPHILHYGRVDLAEKSLKFRVLRPCKGGEQCYLSYGSFSGSHLVNFYGFLPKGDNPYDVIPLDIDAPCAEDSVNQPKTDEAVWSTHMVRGTWLSNSNQLCTYGLPPPLLAHLRRALQDDDNILPPNVPGRTAINKDNERAVLELLISIFDPMLEGLSGLDDIDRESSSWDIKLALDFKDVQRRIISSVLRSCSAGLRLLDRL